MRNSAVKHGAFRQFDGAKEAVSGPGDFRWITFSPKLGVRLNDNAFGCLDCGLVWGEVEAENCRSLYNQTLL